MKKKSVKKSKATAKKTSGAPNNEALRQYEETQKNTHTHRGPMKAIETKGKVKAQQETQVAKSLKKRPNYHKLQG